MLNTDTSLTKAKTGAHIIEMYWFIDKRRAQATIAVHMYVYIV